jgi:biotin synthase
MTAHSLSQSTPGHHEHVSPEFVRISYAAAMELGLKPGSFLRGCGCGCINLLQNYTTSCFANCAYCGLARERPGVSEDKSFIRVDWPMYATALVADKIAEREANGGVGRVCVSQVQHPRAYQDLITICLEIHSAAPPVPISALVSTTTLNEERLHEIKAAGVDIIGIGLDAVTEELFHTTRGKGTRGPHTWRQHWQIVRAARELYGPMNVNCHLMVGLGETDKELVHMFSQLHSEQIAGYLFSFNPEPGTVMESVERTPVRRWRRIQLVKHLIEKEELPQEAIGFDAEGNIISIEGHHAALEGGVESGLPFMTNGCPDRGGEVACNRPYGSYRPGEPFRDYPFQPIGEDVEAIRQDLALHDLIASSPET